METSQVLDNVDVGFMFCILSATSDAPDNYRVEKMRRYLATNGESQVDTDSARFLLMTAPVSEAPIADPATHPAISDAARRQLDIRTACALRSINQQTPLLAGESIEHDDFTFLSAPFNGCRARTPVLRRRTNFATLLYLFAGVTVDASGRLTLDAPSVSARPREAPRVLAAGITFGDVASYIGKGIASGMVSAVGGAIAGRILEAIFPPGVPSYFNQVYEEIKRIVGAELEQATIDQVNGAINNIKVHLATEYQPARQGKDLNRAADRQFLFSLLQKYESTYLTGPGGMMGTLMSDKYAKPGFGAFVLGASVHLSLYQEMANVDPSNTDGSGAFRGPLESSYGRPQSGTIAATARYYAAFADRTWPQILANRAAKIRRSEGTLCAFGDTTGASCHYFAWFRDDLSPGDQHLPGQLPIEGNRVNEALKAESDKQGHNPGRDQLIRDYEDYSGRKAQELQDSMNNPPAIVRDWNVLVATPIKVT